MRFKLCAVWLLAGVPTHDTAHLHEFEQSPTLIKNECLEVALLLQIAFSANAPSEDPRFLEKKHIISSFSESQ